MSPLMKIGKLAFPSSHPASCYSRGNGRDRRPTPRTLSRKLSSVFGENNMTSRTAASSTRRCDPLRSILSGATVGALAANSLPLPKPIKLSSQCSRLRTNRNNEQREVLVMKIWNDLTFAEIASALEISQNTAASRYRYALANLKKNLPPL